MSFGATSQTKFPVSKSLVCTSRADMTSQPSNSLVCSRRSLTPTDAVSRAPFPDAYEFSKEETETFAQSCYNQGYYARFFKQLCVLGRGSRGAVYLVHHKLSSIVLGEYAVKKIPIGSAHVSIASACREVLILQLLRHRNVVEYKHAWIEQSKLNIHGPDDVPSLFILMEYCNGGTLERFLEEKADKYIQQASVASSTVCVLTEDIISSFFMDILQGVAHLHSQGVVHRDLKPANLLLHYSNQKFKPIPRVVLSDFGECQWCESNRRGTTGTLEYIAPVLPFLLRSC